MASKKRDHVTNRELPIKQEGQEYASVIKMLGNGRLEAACFDGVKRLAKIRGAMLKKVWISVGDTILVSLRDYQDAKCDVIVKFTADELRELRRKKLIREELSSASAGAGAAESTSAFIIDIVPSADIDIDDI